MAWPPTWLSTVYFRTAADTLSRVVPAVGIGRETAILFARAGCNLVICARRKEALEEVAQLAKKANQEGGSGKGGEVVAEVVDMSDRAAIKAFVGKLQDLKIDVLVNKSAIALAPSAR